MPFRSADRVFFRWCVALASCLYGCGAAANGAVSGDEPPGGGVKVVHAVGMNLSPPSYYASNMPFLNLMKSGGGWITASDSKWDTGEASYLQLDSDGYPTSLKAAASIPAQQQFTYVKALVTYDMGQRVPGAPSVYPPGVYRLKFKGQGAIRVRGDASHAPGNTCPSDLVLKNSRPDSYASCTFTVSSPKEGLLVQIIAIDSGSDYPRDVSVVHGSQAASYDAGAVFNPAYLAALRGFSSLRFMDWQHMNGEFTGMAATASVPAAATSLTLSSAWTQPSGARPILFIDGERRLATFKTGSAVVTWSDGLAHAISDARSWTWGAQAYYATFYLINKTWGDRSKPSDAFWDHADGVPLEIIVDLCNQLGTGNPLGMNCHFTVPLAYSDADIQAMGRLVMSGAGMRDGYGALANPHTATFELSNEVWNASFNQYKVAGLLGGSVWPSSSSGGGNFEWNRQYFGMRTAQMAGDLRSAVGTGLFARVIPVLGAQAANPWTATESLAASYWKEGRAADYPIKAIAIAPYWGGTLPADDCAVMTGQSDGGLADFFATLYGQAGAHGVSYRGVPSGGWLGQAEGWVKGYVQLMSRYPSMHLIAYEGGQTFIAASSGTCAGWPDLVTRAERDPLMGDAYARYLAHWQSAVGDSVSAVNNLYSDVGPISKYGAWGLLESIMQPIAPLSSAPAKYRAVSSYIRGAEPVVSDVSRGR